MNTSKKVFSRIGLALVAGYLAMIGVGSVFLVQLVNAVGLEKLAETLGPSLTILLTYVPNVAFLLVFWLVIRTIPRSEWQGEQMSFRSLTQIFVMMYVVSSALNLIGQAVSKAAPAGGTEALDLINEVVTSGLPIGILMTVLIAPVVEELVFRKLMLDRIRNCGEKTAIVFSALCFGLFHGNLTQFLYAFSVGLFLGYVYCKTGKVLYTMIMHALLNLLSSSIMLLLPALGRDEVGLVLIPIALVVVFLNVSGVVQLIRHLKRRDLHLDNSMETCIPKGEVLKTVYLNPCVMLFVLCYSASIVMDLLKISL